MCLFSTLTFRLRFIKVFFRTKIEPFKTNSNGLISANPNLSCQVLEEQLVVNENELFTLNLAIIDKISSQVISNISWAVSISFLNYYFVIHS